ncbi:dihydrofolate reductase family protein [Piscinibacter sp. XHJ-5]|uniref:dihydrofolate reductase family protein n=1 Tax=Piscinibacter sp. XHJ-5 TaxID=3037797 RepID=UPI0024531E8F|nr:dihydrofolate reductase family protein [Piscinibacter sp. XHJ-5]
MRKLSVFESVSLDGYFKAASGDIAWMHQGGDDPEFQSFTAANAAGGGVLLMGRTTYELFASHWPTPQAMQQMPEVAGPMNAMPKVVVSRSLGKATWNNTKVLKGDLAAEVRKLKAEPGEAITVLGSGSIVSQLTQAGLVDEFQVVVVPVALGDGRTMFEGVKNMLTLRLVTSRTFRNGRVFLVYEPHEAPDG